MTWTDDAGMPRRHPTLIFVHVVWATQRRHPTLPAHVDSVLVHILREKALELGCKLIAAGCADEHVHVLLRVAPTIALSELMQRLKGASAYALNRHPNVPVHVAWQHGYWAETVSPAALGEVERYVREQRGHHASQRDRSREPVNKWSGLDDDPEPGSSPARSDRNEL